MKKQWVLFLCLTILIVLCACESREDTIRHEFVKEETVKELKSVVQKIQTKVKDGTQKDGVAVSGNTIFYTSLGELHSLKILHDGQIELRYTSFLSQKTVIIQTQSSDGTTNERKVQTKNVSEYERAENILKAEISILKWFL